MRGLTTDAAFVDLGGEAWSSSANPDGFKTAIINGAFSKVLGGGGNDEFRGFHSEFGGNILDDARDIFDGGPGNDRLFGIGGDDLLIGGLGLDNLIGGTGNDVFNVDIQGEAVESPNGGLDTVRSRVSYILGPNLENLELIGPGNLNGTGNDLANLIVANARVLGGADNSLDGRGGNDTLTGFGGADRFLFTTAPGGSRLSPNIDFITDMQAGLDEIRLENAVFVGLAAGDLAAAAFRIGAAAADADDRVIYNLATGVLLFDRDGTGAAAQLPFATVTPGLALTNLDFFVI
jgi:Ca2+-binding RTX toxin-like protein